MNKFFQILFLAIPFLISSCVDSPDHYQFLEQFDVVGRHCDHELVYTSEHRFESTYVDITLHEWKMKIDVDHFRNYQITALEVAKLAMYIAKAHEAFHLPNNNGVKSILSSGHYVVVEDDYLFNELFYNEHPEQYGAFIKLDSEYICWEHPAEANWSSVIRSKHYNAENPNVIIHEMIHAVSLASFGNSDSEHKNELLWDHFGEDTVQGRALYLYYLSKLTFLNIT